MGRQNVYRGQPPRSWFGHLGNSSISLDRYSRIFHKDKKIFLQKLYFSHMAKDLLYARKIFFWKNNNNNHKYNHPKNISKKKSYFLKKNIKIAQKKKKKKKKKS